MYEPDITLLDSSADPIEARVRGLMNEWYAEYPKHSRADLKARFRSEDHGAHLGALNELFLHALFRRIGYEVGVVPAGPRNQRQPDFALTSNTLPDFDLEATVAEISREERSRRQRAAVFYKTVDRIKTTDFTLAVWARSGPDTDPPSRKLRNGLQQWVDRLDADAVPSTNTNGMDDLPTHHFSHGGWRVKFWAMPKEAEFRDVIEDTPIGVYLTGVHILDSQGHIRRALEDKTTKYGERRRPYVIAIATGIDNPFPRAGALRRALFGSERWLVQPETGAFGTARESDGIFWGPNGPRNTRVSGVILIPSLDAWRIAYLKLIYMENPWAKHRLLYCPTVFDRYFVNKDDGKLMERNSELALHELFDLPRDWPECDAP